MRLWDVLGGCAFGEPLSGHTWWVTSVSFSADGRYVVSGSRDGTVRVWDVSSGACLTVLRWGRQIWAVSWSNILPLSSSRIAIGDKDSYSEFGYKQLDQFGISLPFEVPKEKLMAIELIENSLSGIQGIVEYPEKS